MCPSSQPLGDSIHATPFDTREFTRCFTCMGNGTSQRCGVLREHRMGAINKCLMFSSPPNRVPPLCREIGAYTHMSFEISSGYLGLKFLKRLLHAHNMSLELLRASRAPRVLLPGCSLVTWGRYSLFKIEISSNLSILNSGSGGCTFA